MQVEKLIAKIESSRFAKSKIAAVFPELLLVVSFIVTFYWLRKFSELPVEAYSSTYIFLEAIHHLFSDLFLVILGLFLGTILFICRKRIFLRWLDLDNGKSIRAVAFVSAIAFIWPLSASPFNYFSNQWHGLDRLLLVVFLIVLWFRPIACLPILLIGGPMVWEFSASINIYPWEFFGMPMRMLILVFVFLLFHSLNISIKFSAFFFVALCIVASHYWIPGFHKLLSGWFFENEVFYFLSSTYSNGWLGFLSQYEIANYANLLSRVNVPILAISFVIECLCLFIISFKLKSIRFFLIGFPLFHIGILLISGIFLWQWILIEGALLCILSRKSVKESISQYTIWHKIAALGLIFLSPIWLKTASLTWFDSPVNYVCKFEAIDDDGQRHDLSPQFFAPFDEQFTFNGFSYLLEDVPTLNIQWGATSREISRELKMAHNSEDVFEIEKRLGSIRFEQSRKDVMKEFLLSFLGNYNRRTKSRSTLEYLAPPPSIVTFPLRTQVDRIPKIRGLEIYHVTSFFSGNEYREIRRKLVMTMNF